MTAAIGTPGAPAAAQEQADEAARQLEAYFLRRVLSEIKSSSGGMLSGGFAGETFQQMLNEALADSMADAGGLGLSQIMGAELGAAAGAAPTTGRQYRPVGQTAAAGAGLQSPVEGVVSSRFGRRKHPITGERKLHAGLDIAAQKGTAVQAAAGGKVVRAGRAGGYGNLVVVEHPNGLETRYAHLDRIDVKVGQTLEAGASIGAVGSTGASTGPHLHFEVRRNGVAMDPQKHLNGHATYRNHANPEKK